MEDIDYRFILDYTEDIVISLGVLLLLAVEIWLVNKGSTHLKNRVEKFDFQAFKVKSLELLDIGKQRLFLKGIITFTQIVFILTIIYFSLVLALSILPGSENVANKLIEFIFLPLKDTFFNVVGYLPDLFTVLIIVIIFRFLISMVKSISQEIVNKKLKIQGFEAHWARTTGSIIIFLLNILMIILILPYMPGYESIAFKGVIAFLGALITIGGSSIIANYMAGIVITYMNSYRIGDWVQIDDTTGEIQEISSFAIKIKTYKNVIVSIPNSKILTTHINNFGSDNSSSKIILHTTVSIGYNAPMQKVNEILISAANKTEGLDLSTVPFVRQVKLDDFYIVYELNAFSRKPSKTPLIYSELHKYILEEFDKAGIEMLSPHYRAERDGSKSTISRNK